MNESRARASASPLFLVVVLASLAIAALLSRRPAVFGAGTSAAARECRVRYASAITQKDTARVDRSYLTAYREERSKVGPKTCRAFR